jgi:hypothetical protein
MSTDQEEIVAVAAPAVEGKVESKSKFASRGDFLAAAGRFKEEELEVEGIGRLVLSEISGDARADIIGTMAMALQPNTETGEKGTLDTKGYQRSLLLAGVVDPTSAAGSRVPLFKIGDLAEVMRVGGAKITAICDVIERLSMLGRHQPDAEKNSGPTPSVASTS